MPARVAVILPVYNGATHLRDVINAVFRQTYPHWQFYILDDNSQDDSLEIARSLSTAQCVIIPGVSNLGLYGRLAQALPSVAEEWVALIMQDDRPKPRWLEELVKLSNLHPEVDALWASEDIIDASGARIRNGPHTGRTEIIQPSTSAWYSILRRGCIWQISGSLTRTDLFRRTPFRADLPHCGDFDWLLRAVRSSKFLYYEEALIDLRIHKGQASTANLASGRDMAEACSVVISNLQAHPFDLSLAARLRLTMVRTRSAVLRVLAALRHGNIPLARTLMPCVLRYSFLFLVRPGDELAGHSAHERDLLG